MVCGGEVDGGGALDDKLAVHLGEARGEEGDDGGLVLFLGPGSFPLGWQRGGA